MNMRKQYSYICDQLSLNPPFMFAPQLNLIFLPQPTNTLNGYPSTVYPMLNLNQSAFLNSILLPYSLHADALNGYPFPVYPITGLLSWRVFC